MGGIFRDGFDTYASGTAAGVDFLTKWSSSTNVTFPAGRFSGLAADFNGTQTSAPLDSAPSAFSVTCGMYMTTGSATAGRGHLRLLSAGTYQVGLMISNLGEVIAYRQTGLSAGTELGRSATGVFAFSAWQTLEWECVISDTVGRFTVWIDGTQVLNLTSQDTRNGVPTTVDTIELYGNGSRFICDDLWVEDSATRPSAALRCETLFPTSDGATLNFTPSTGTSHFAVVDEAQASASDFLQGTTVGDLDELGLGDLASTPTSIAAVCVVGYLQKTDATARSMAMGVKSGATTSDGANFSLNSTGKRHERLLATDPNTAAAWTASGVNALQLRPKVTV